LERNKRFFRSSSVSQVASIYVLILHLYKYWTSSLADLEHMVAAMTTSQPSIAISSAQVNGVFLLVGTQFSDSVEDEDLIEHLNLAFSFIVFGLLCH
jgi:uncharacterized membrane protein